ncbi:hypothetical protein J3R30DRAFT_3295500 [Lentinula aciculospora]|uniref:Uncharacterized protein n=1 Tax=Lentinula aciculospora TaxID=153920 RepID=A0A9W9A4I6_9AGAR|nr:hypothetical protein J3R30DRAFT_3295500 [Lentinula aciculospora]
MAQVSTDHFSTLPVRKDYRISIALHIILVLVHVALIVVRFAGIGHNENRVIVPLGPRANTLSVAITIVSQIIGVVYLAGQVLVLQQLALRKVFHVSRTVTAVHDVYGAWNGLGSALSAVINQGKLATSLWGVVAVAVYLGGVSVLHITIPATLSLATFNRTYSATANVQHNTPSFPGGRVQEDMESAASALPLMSYLAHTNASLGIYGNLIFDSVTCAFSVLSPFVTTIPGYFPIYNRTILTNATIFHVTCGLMPTAEQNGTSNGLSWNVNTPIQNGSLSGDLVNPPFKLLAPYAIRLLPLNYKFSDIATSILLYASVNITDDQGHNGTILALDPPMNCVWTEDILDISWTTTVVGCNLQAEQKGVSFDTASKNITGSDIPPRNTSRDWQDWQPLVSGQDQLVETWGSISNIKTRTAIRTNNCSELYDWEPNQNFICGWDDYLTPAELYLNNQLGLSPVLSGQPRYEFNARSVSLANLELALENMTAAIYWACDEIDPSELPNEFATLSFIQVIAYVPKAHLNINTVPLIVGSVMSLILLVISVRLTSGHNHGIIDSELNMVGILQFMWLLGKGSPVQDQIADVQLPSTDNLRQAGLVSLKLSNSVIQRGVNADDWKTSE